MTAQTWGEKYSINGHAKVDGETPQVLDHTQRSIGNWGKLEMEEVAFPREEYTDELASDKWSALKTYIELTYMYACTHMHMITML